MNTPTPRTDSTVALVNWNGALERAMKAEADLIALEQCHDDNCRALVKIAAELTAVTAERDQLRAEVERTDAIYQGACEVEHELRAEVERLRSDRDCEKRLRKDADEFRENAIERAERAEAAETVALAHWNGALERAIKAEADLAALGQCHDDNCRAVVRLDAELAAAKERLRSEAMDDYASIKNLQRELATERARLKEDAK
jgi:chromosome segregation ATPase